MKILDQLILTVFSSTIFALALPNEIMHSGSAILGLFALVPFYKAIQNAKSFKNAALLCAVHALVIHCLSSFWLGFFKDFAVFTLGASAFGTAALQAFASLAFYLPAFLVNSTKNLYSQRKILMNTLKLPAFKALWFAMSFTLWEYLKSSGFLAYPWGTLYMSSYNLKILSQSIRLFGTEGITFIFALFAAAFSEYLDSAVITSPQKAFYTHKKLISCTGLIFIVLTIYGVFCLNRKLTPVTHLNTALIQQNLDPWKNSESDEDSIHISQKLTEEALSAAKNTGFKTDLVVWSEGILRMPFPTGKNYYRFEPSDYPLIRFVQDNKVPFIIGGSWFLNETDFEICNAAVVFDKEGGISGFYGKRHLVPFAESLPFTQYTFIRNLLKKYLGFSFGWTPGKEYTLFDIPSGDSSVKISIPICFEDAFSDLCADLKNLGSQVYINITDDSWSKTKSAEYQHFIIAWFRAIEFNTTLVRSTNSGCTAVIDPKGRILESLPLFEEKFLLASIPVYDNKPTVNQVFNGWFKKSLAVLFNFCLILAIIVKNNKFFYDKLLQTAQFLKKEL